LNQKRRKKGQFLLNNDRSPSHHSHDKTERRCGKIITNRRIEYRENRIHPEVLQKFKKAKLGYLLYEKRPKGRRRLKDEDLKYPRR